MDLKSDPIDNHSIWYEKIPQPEDLECLIWRYMDFSKFISILESETLFFSRLDLLDDPFEGSTPKQHVDAFRGMNPDLEFRSQDKYLNEAIRSSIFVSCWHRSEFESDALWQLYGSKGQSIAICSRYSKLRKLPNVKVGLVEYVDYDQAVLEQPVAEVLAVLKRRSFDFEKEVRAIAKKRNETFYTDKSGQPFVRFDKNTFAGLRVSVTPQDFIEKIVVSPLADEWFVDLIKKLLRRYKLDIRVESSDLTREPLFEGMGTPVTEQSDTPDS